jgi:hypothetical protein
MSAKVREQFPWSEQCLELSVALALWHLLEQNDINYAILSNHNFKHLPDRIKNNIYILCINLKENN